ncbi:MAG: response regulator [Deltaproteobacteria bacterium]|nr:response regulator [Deltaproteobacteria bacterium]
MAKKILLVEDSATMRKVVELTFAADGDQVTCVDTVEQAIIEAKRAPPDILIADISMDGKNGYDACMALKEMGMGAIPKLLLYSERSRLDPQRARKVGADAELKKPFKTQEIIDKVEALLRKKASPLGLVVTPLSTLIETRDVVIEASPASLASPRPSGAENPPETASLKPPKKPTTQETGLPQPPAGMPRLGSLAIRRGSSAPPAPSAHIPEPKAADESLDVEITIEADPPPEVEISVVPTPHKGAPTPPTSLPATPRTLPPPPRGMPHPPSAMAGTIDTKPKKVAPKPHLGRQAPLKPAVAAPAAPEAPSVSVEKKVAAVAQRAASEVQQVANEVLPAGLRGLDPVVVTAITKLTREVVERVVWEVVPELAEAIIKEELERLLAAREK